ncbi:pro-sigmaK processing inhibitor BofA family protein [Lachnospiraceae bacterium ZAX-1]
MEYGVLAIALICLIVLLIGVLKQKAQIVLNFCVRMVLGMISVYFLNHFLEIQHIELAVGLNPISALTVGILGISGFALLYGIMLYKFL